ncbi:NACHT, LRR and PYD domains-containing protein 12-like [Pezoporus wallicus]|uniref:NACHT, LRR and PYD domains-containing protein 12-like n=1 Tax=Pezoporus wallicus TaxID=35540 RepID=UPI00255171BB|nr:NACHT, LRR and PYD domains-containing protein 12-like [Pezoporus wallicus]
MAEEEPAVPGLLRALQGLPLKGFQEFKTKLSEVQVEGGWKIPEDSLARASHPWALLHCMGESYSEDVAMEVAIGVLREMNLGDLAEELLGEVVKEHKQKYKEHVVQGFLRYKEVNSRPGESRSVRSHFTPLAITRKPRSKREAAATSHGCADTSSGPATISTLFNPGADGQSPQVVVLVGAPGMGKTMAVRKVMVEWGEGIIYTQFDYVFCIDCKDTALPKEASVAELVSKCCPHRRVPVGKILEDHKRILFILDGFEALGFALVQPELELSSDPSAVKPLEATLMGLLKKTLLPESSLLITTRPMALQSLGQCLEGEDYVEIVGFSGAAREEYFHRYFGNDHEADVAFGFARANEILYSLCSIPVMSWTVCSILQQELRKGKDLTECSKATAWIGVLYLSWLAKHRGRGSPQDLHPFLLQLCSLAADGIWKHKVLFEEKAIKDRGLDQPDLLPLFLNEKIPGEGVEHGNSYGFTHLHLQEFFAAMFYVLEGNVEVLGDSRDTADIKVLLESYSESREDLNVTVRFLFGLASRECREHMDNTLGCRSSPRAKEELLSWLQGRHRGTSQPGPGMKLSRLDTFHFLFEMNDESVARRALGAFSAMELQDTKLTLYDQMALSFCIRQWPGLGSVTLRGCSFHQQDPKSEAAASVPCNGPADAGAHPGPMAEPQHQELRSPMDVLCRALRHPGSDLRVLRLQWCRLPESCCAALAALLAQHRSLERLELGDTALGDRGVRLLCQGLRQPGCCLRALRLRYSRLTSACCKDLAAVLSTSPCLEELDLSFSEGLRDAGAELLCEGLRPRSCRLRTLRLGSCRLTGACCRALAAGTPPLTCLDLSDNELGADGVLQLCRQLRSPSCPLRALGLSTAELPQDALQALAALQELKPSLKVGYLLEQEVPQTGAMARLPFHRGALPGRRVPPSLRRGALL